MATWRLALILFLPRLINAARAFDDTLFISTDPNETLGRQDDLKDHRCSTWGDLFRSAEYVLWTTDCLWFGAAIVLAATILLRMPEELRVDGVGSGFIDNKLQPIAWYRAAFQSFTSHAAGIVGFAGFQYIVVAKIVMSTAQCQIFTVTNILLYVTLTLSVVAVMTSLVFLGVDYMRRLVMDTAQQKGFRLMMEPRVLEQTGLGRSVCLLVTLMLCLYVLEICREVIQKHPEEDTGWYLWLLFKTAGGCATVALFYFNLRGLYRSPKVFFDTTCHSAAQEITLEAFLDDQSGGSLFLAPLANSLQVLGGEDLALLVTRGSRQALLPRHQFAPVLHVLFIILFVGFFPIGVQKGMERLFLEPELVNLKALAGDLVHITQKDDPAWQNGFGFFASSREQYLLLLNPEDTQILMQVTPAYRQTSSVELCCQKACDWRELDHSMITFHQEPLPLKVAPGDISSISSCTVTLLGFTSSAVRSIPVQVESKDTHHVCQCTEDHCACCPGYHGSFVWSAKNHMPSGVCKAAPCNVQFSNGVAGKNCACANAYTGDINWTMTGFHGTCVPARCPIENSNKLKGLECKCDKKFVGDITWNGSEAVGSCEPAPCIGGKLTERAGIECRCKDGYTGEPEFVGGVLFDRGCSEAVCDIPNSIHSGPSCRCQDEFAGKIFWKGHEAFGSCTPAPCEIPFSNKEPGLKCKCEEPYVGTIRWTNALPSGTCAPASCSDKLNLNGRPGPECRCKDGYKGQPKVEGFSFTDSACELAKCTVLNSTGNGTDCRCKNGFEGEIVWNGATSSGSCQPAPCTIHNTNGMPGRQCKCLPGYTGKITWLENRPKGSCRKMDCQGENVNEVAGPGCACKHGFSGVIENIGGSNNDDVDDYNDDEEDEEDEDEEDEHMGFFLGECKAADCNVPKSNFKAGTDCKCQDGFLGEITWNGSVAQGNCTPAPCDLPNSQMKPGPECKCKEGFEGEVRWDKTERRYVGDCRLLECRGGHVNYVNGPGCRCANGYNGTIKEDFYDNYGLNWQRILSGESCAPAPCNVENSDMDGPECHCQEGYRGNITWDGPVAQGNCTPAPCTIPNSNMKPGPECSCEYGFLQNIHFSHGEWRGVCHPLPCVGEHVNGIHGPQCACKDGFFGNVSEQYKKQWDEIYEEPFEELVLSGECQPAPCNVLNSSMEAGPHCRCRAGYAGEVTWKGSMATGSCVPAPCGISNSNKRNGLDCQCLDGYRGSITWEGTTPSGSCVPVQCRVPYSDFAAGPHCQCLPGFYGHITWNGTQVEGECLPLPKCSDHVVQVTWLRHALQDEEGRTCEANQKLVFHGHACKNGLIQWTLLQSSPPGRCQWAGAEEDESACGQRSPTKALLSAISTPLPMECSPQSALPRCDAMFEYIITSRRASQYMCDGFVAAADSIQLVEFRGRQCGYDLIQWETAIILGAENMEDRLPKGPSCDMKKPSQERFQCGEIPFDENLPHGCLHMREPAVFTLAKATQQEKTTQGLVTWWTHSETVKLFDTGMSAMGSSLTAEPSSVRWCTDNPWLTDGKYLLFEVLQDIEDAEDHDHYPYFDFFGQRLEGDHEGSNFYHYSGKFSLLPLTLLPPWWVSRFQEAVEPRSFQLDGMVGCRTHAYQSGVCYQFWIGHQVHIFKGKESHCRDDMDATHGQRYKYSFSQFGIQTYTNSGKSCFPLARHDEIKVEFANVQGVGSRATVVVMETECRKNLRLVVDAAHLPCKKSTFVDAWVQRKFYG